MAATVAARRHCIPRIARAVDLVSHVAMYFPLIIASLALPADLVELKPESFAAHDAPVWTIASDAKGKRLFTMTQAGAVSEWSFKSDDFAWTSEPDRLGQLEGANPDLHLSIGDEVATRTGAGPIAAYKTIHLEDGAVTQGGAAPMNPTAGVGGSAGAILTDPKDRWVWLGSSDGTLARLTIDSFSGWSRRAVKNQGVTALALDPKGNDLAVGGADGTVRFVGNKSCDVDEKAVFEGHESAVTVLAWHPKGKLIASADGGGQIYLRDRRSGKTRRALEVPGQEITCLSFHPKGTWLAAGDGSGNVWIWSAKSGDLLAKTTIGDGSKKVTGLVVLEGGKRLVVSVDKSLHSMDVAGVRK